MIVSVFNILQQQVFTGPLPKTRERQRAKIPAAQRRFALTDFGERKLGISNDEATRFYRDGWQHLFWGCCSVERMPYVTLGGFGWASSMKLQSAWHCLIRSRSCPRRF